MTLTQLPELTLPIPPPPALMQHSEHALDNVLPHLRDGLIEAPNPQALSRHLDAIFSASPFIAKHCAAQPDLLVSLLNSGDLLSPYSAGQYSKNAQAALTSTSDDGTFMRQLRHFRHREMIRIAWRDLAGWAETEETLRDLTHLAESCIQAALAQAQTTLSDRYGVPRSAAGKAQEMSVIGMGKLGGHELNFSSDIDLIFAFPERGQTDGKTSLDNQQFFIRVGQQLIKLLNETTADGFVYRVDMRLRPFGDSGALAASFPAIEDYYLLHGREWERYAMIKARVVAGQSAQSDELLKNLKPFIYRRYLDYGAFDALRELKRMISTEVKRKGLQDNIKLGPGGIREIEFIGQAFQLVRGGHEPQLQSRSIITTLNRLAESGHIHPDDSAKLIAAYDFLRRAENRLQMVDDQQTHDLPADKIEQMRLAYSMGYPDWKTFYETLSKHRQVVQTQFDAVFHADEPGDSATSELWLSVWASDAHSESFESAVLEAGFQQPETCDRLRAFKRSIERAHLSHTAQKRLDTLMPRLLQALTQLNNPDETLGRLLPFLEHTAGRSVYLSLLFEQPHALDRLVRLFGASAWVAEFIIQHPIVIDELIDERLSLNLPSKADLLHEARQALSLHGEDLGEQMDALRRFRQAHICRIVCLDIEQKLPLMNVSDQLTWLAEAVIGAAYEQVLTQLTEAHGTPTHSGEGGAQHAELAVIAYGKLGGIELGYGSDLDLVFLHDNNSQSATTDGPTPIPNTQFFIKLTQKIVHFLTTLTAAGKLYDIDTRLRPNGASGLLVSSLTAFEHYQQDKAWTWEHQALVRARVVVGSKNFEEKFQTIRNRALQKKRESDALLKDVISMREKMRKALGSHKDKGFHIKQDKGGIVDIEFMVQYAVLVWGNRYPALLEYTDNYRLLDALQNSGVMKEGDAGLLKTAYLFYRNRLHQLALEEKPSIVEMDTELSRFRDQVSTIWQSLMSPSNQH